MDPKLTGEAATWLTITGQLFSARMGALLSPHNLTIGQFSILHHIARPELMSGTRISDIAQAIEMKQPAVTKTIAKFENMGLVSLRSTKNDKRVKTVAVEAKALQLLDQIRVGMGPDLAQAFGAIEANRLPAFIEDLKRLGKWLDKNRLNG